MLTLANMSGAKSARLTFPVRLHGLLTQAAKLGLDNIISWHSSGKKFIIYDQEEFVDKILPNIFKQSKFASFRRQMNAYGFERELNPDKTKEALASFLVYSHEHFLKEDPQACSKIARRQRSPQNESTSPILSSVLAATNAVARAGALPSSKNSSQSSSPKYETHDNWNLKSFLASSVNIADFALNNQSAKTINTGDTESQDSQNEILRVAQFSSNENREQTNAALWRAQQPHLIEPLHPLFSEFKEEEPLSCRNECTVLTSSGDPSIYGSKMEEEQTHKTDTLFQDHDSGLSRISRRTNLHDTILDELADAMWDSDISRDCINCWDPKEESLGGGSPILSAF